MTEQSAASESPQDHAELRQDDTQLRHDHAELRQLADADQADRTAGGGAIPAPEDWPAIMERDRARRQRVAELLEAGSVRTGADHFHAALVFQHGEASEDYWRAHELARQAVELGEPRGRWLAAAALDRWLMHQGRPQRYGTQYTQVDGRWVLWDVDPTTTDDERAAWDVPPLAAARQPAAAGGSMDAFLEDPPLASLAVPGLRVEIKRWLGPTPPKDRPKPRPVSLASDDPMRPGYLPDNLQPARLDGGFCAVDAAGNIRVSWRAFPLKAGQLLVSGWLDEFGPAPMLEPAPTLEPASNGTGRPGIWIGAGHGTPEQLVLGAEVTQCGAELTQCWIVSGDVGRDELVRVAASLPSPPAA